MRFASALIAVKDMKVSRDFYEGLLGLRVEFDFGKNLSFEGGLALQESFAQLIGMQPDAVIWRANNGELYFEEEDLEGFVQRLDHYGAQMVHEMMEQPWGQRAVRFYDPDGHIVEVGEPMPCVVARLLDEGMQIQAVAQRTMLPVAAVENIAAHREQGK